MTPSDLFVQSEADVQHLWFGLRACTRIRSELMAAIYDKSLKRKDFSGIITDSAKADNAAAASGDAAKKDSKDGKDSTAKKNGKNGKGKDKEAAAKEKKEKATADDPKAGADVGKIVNLMAGDANRVRRSYIC